MPSSLPGTPGPPLPPRPPDAGAPALLDPDRLGPLAFLICLAVLSLVTCFICFCLKWQTRGGSGGCDCWRRRGPRRGPSGALPDRFQPDQTGHLYSHVIFAERAYRAQIAGDRAVGLPERQTTELRAPHGSQLHPSYLPMAPPAYSECVTAGRHGFGEGDDRLEWLSSSPPPEYASAVAAHHAGGV